MAGSEGEGDTPDVVIPFPATTPQERGRRYERRRAKEQGLRAHPASGAGHIKYDASDENRLVEYKTAASSYTINAKYVLAFYKRAVREGKDAMMELHFPKHNLTCTITFRKA